MQFTVTNNTGYEANDLDTLNTIPALAAPSVTRYLPYFEEMSAIDEPLGVFLTGQKWAAPITEEPVVGTTEWWYLINPTGDAHPIHLHLVQFQVVARRPFNASAYTDAWLAANPGAIGPNGFTPLNTSTTPVSVSPATFYTGPWEYPGPEEDGWFDTTITPPEYVTVIKVRFAQQDGSAFPFDATDGPGYVWHCHILDHEDNEMMRPYRVVSPPPSP